MECRCGSRQLRLSMYPSLKGVSVFANEVTNDHSITRFYGHSLTAAIDSTDTLIWAVDRGLRLSAFNKPFREAVKRSTGEYPAEGMDILTVIDGHVDHARAFAKWRGCFERVLLGGKVILEQEMFGDHYECLMTPIRQDDSIVGVSVFCANISDRKDHEIALKDAYRQIGELKLMALRAAMNPHLIFNTLNAIQGYILENDKENAVHYLSDFSRLIRGILHHAIQTHIPLREEIDLLRRYVGLERMRFDYKFDAHITVDSSVKDNVEIPSMIIQPFVENAIVHGLANKDGRGRIDLRVMREGDTLVIEIDDDGVGRKYAMARRRRMNPDHRSLGIELTSERMKLMGAVNPISFDIIDKHQGNKPTGTLVRILLPYRPIGGPHAHL